MSRTKSNQNTLNKARPTIREASPWSIDEQVILKNLSVIEENTYWDYKHYGYLPPELTQSIRSSSAVSRKLRGQIVKLHPWPKMRRITDLYENCDEFQT